jgi:hypothetical protein
MSTQRGPVEPGRPAGEPIPMDADLALVYLQDALDGMPSADPNEKARDAAALAAVRGVVDTARRYVRGRTVGRFLELARALQETPDVDRPHEVTEAQVERYLRAQGQMRITTEVARKLGLIT